MASPTPTQPPVTVVATSAYKTPDFWVNTFAVVALIAQLPAVQDVIGMIPHADLDKINKVILALVAVTNVVAQQLRNRPTQLNLLPGQTQAVRVDPLPITSTTVKDATSTPK